MIQHLRGARHRRPTLWLLGGALTALVGCSGDDDGDGPDPIIDPTTVTVTVAGGDNQSAPAGGRLDSALQVRLRTPDNEPARDLVVRFRVVQGSARLLDSIATSDFDGIARGTLLLGPNPEAVRVTAELRDAPARNTSFTATGTTPPALVRLEPAAFGPGDTVRIVGRSFGSGAANAQALFGGERGLLVRGSATDSTLRVVVPPCVPSGNVSVTVTLANVTTNALAATSAGRSAPLRLAEFEAVTLPGAQVASCLSLAGNARYALLPSFAATQDFAIGRDRDSVPGFPFVIGATGPVTPSVARPQPPRERNVADEFHLWLRWQEKQLAGEAAVAYRTMQRDRTDGVSLSLARASVPEVGSTRTFSVLNSLTASPSTYATITARLVYAGSNILLYVDAATPTVAGVTDQTYAALGAQFNDDLFPIDARTFGQPTDIDANGRTFVLFTPVVNRLTADRPGCGSYIAGFFNGIDLVANASRGNRAEIFYGSVPGVPISSQANCLLSLANWQRTTPATFIHELQHLISYGQHVLRRGGESEDVWLNEGLSHIAEELGGKLYEARFPPPSGRGNPDQIWPDAAQGFVPPNFSNAFDFFRASTDYSLTSPTEFGTLEERGVAWLFLRWLGDQKGERIYGQLVQTNRLGTANVEAVAGEPFTRLFADYITAVLLDNFPGADTTRINPRYQFTSRDLRRIYARLNTIDRQNYPVAYPLDVANLSAAERLGAGQTATGSLKPGGFDLFELRLGASAANAAFRPPSGSFQSTLNAQLTVVRLP